MNSFIHIKSFFVIHLLHFVYVSIIVMYDDNANVLSDTAVNISLAPGGNTHFD